MGTGGLFEDPPVMPSEPAPQDAAPASAPSPKAGSYSYSDLYIAGIWWFKKKKSGRSKTYILSLTHIGPT